MPCEHLSIPFVHNVCLLRDRPAAAQPPGCVPADMRCRHAMLGAQTDSRQDRHTQAQAAQAQAADCARHAGIARPTPTRRVTTGNQCNQCCALARSELRACLGRCPHARWWPPAHARTPQTSQLPFRLRAVQRVYNIAGHTVRTSALPLPGRATAIATTRRPAQRPRVYGLAPTRHPGEESKHLLPPPSSLAAARCLPVCCARGRQPRQACPAAARGRRLTYRCQQGPPR